MHPLHARSPAPSCVIRGARAMLALACTVMLAACAIRPLTGSGEQAVDSVALPPESMRGISSEPFCLHLRHRNTFLAAASANEVEAWITSGTCQSAGKPLAVDAIRVTLRFDWYDTQTTQQCLQTDRCVFSERHAGEGRHIRCASAQARQGNQTAFISSDLVRCY